MQIQLEDLGPTKKRLSVEIPAETASAEMERLVSSYRRQARLKGFRPGKAPASIIRRLFGAQIEQEVSQKLIEENLPEAIEESGLSLVSQPVLEEASFTPEGPFTFTVALEITPAFEISGYEGLNLTREIVEVDDKMVENRIGELRQAYASTRSLPEPRPLAEGDIAVIDYTAFSGEDPLEGGANPNYQLEIGSGRFHPEFESSLIGLSSGEERTATVDFPEGHHNPKLAGKTIRFETKLLDIKEKVVPEADDEFAKDLGQEGIETLDQLKDRIRQELTDHAAQRSETALREQVRERLVELVDIPLPEGLVAHELDVMVRTMLFNLQRSGLTMEAMGLSEAKLREDYRPEAEKRVKVGLILDRIAKDRDLSVSDDDIQDRILSVARDLGQPPEVVRNIYNKNEMMEELRNSCLTEKTLKYILGAATIENVESQGNDAEDPDPGPGETNPAD